MYSFKLPEGSFPALVLFVLSRMMESGYLCQVRVCPPAEGQEAPGDQAALGHGHEEPHPQG